MKINSSNLNCLVGTLTLDKNNIIQSFDTSLEELFGYASIDLIGKPLSTIIFHAEHNLTYDQSGYDKPRVISRALGREQELVGRRNDGIVFPVWFTVDEVLGNDGKSLVATVVGLPASKARKSKKKSIEVREKEARDIIASLDSTLSSPLEAPLSTTLAVRENFPSDGIYLQPTEISPPDVDQPDKSSAALEVHAIIQSAISGIFTFDDKGIIHLFNPAAEKIFGWNQQEIVNRNISILLEEPYPLQHDAYLRSTLISKESKIIGIEREVIACRKNKTTFPAHMAIGHAKISDSNHFFVGFIVDISEQKNYEANLERAKEEAETGLRIKTKFIADMRSEIQDPINSIMTYANAMLQDHELAPQHAKDINVIVDSAKILMNVINNILDISTLNNDKFAQETVAFHLPDALADALQLIDRQGNQRGIKMAIEYDTSLPLRFMGNPTRLKQVLQNLVNNTIKFTERENIIVSVKKWDTPNTLHFTVTDSCATAEHQLSSIEPTSQIESNRLGRLDGTDMVTAISKQIVELMGGKIWVDNQAGAGSALHFTAHMPEIVFAKNSLQDPSYGITDGYISPRLFTVLLVESVETNATLIMLRLKEQGHEVVWTTDSAGAIESFQSRDFDLILMDTCIPGISGLEITQKIRELEESENCVQYKNSAKSAESGASSNSDAEQDTKSDANEHPKQQVDEQSDLQSTPQPTRHIPILALTSNILYTEYDNCVKAGMDSVHAKPIDFNDLLLTMEQIVPKDRGTTSLAYTINIFSGNEIDFSPLEGVVDHCKATETWHNTTALAKALANFAADRINDANQIEKLLMADGDNLYDVCQITDTLKGLAGNLCITKVANSAIKIDTELKAKHRITALAELEHLKSHLIEAAGAIKNLGSH